MPCSICCVRQAQVWATCESWSFMNGEQYVNGSVLNVLIISWVNAHFLLFILGKAVLCKYYQITKASELSCHESCTVWNMHLYAQSKFWKHTDEFSLSQPENKTTRLGQPPKRLSQAAKHAGRMQTTAVRLNLSMQKLSGFMWAERDCFQGKNTRIEKVVCVCDFKS